MLSAVLSAHPEPTIINHACCSLLALAAGAEGASSTLAPCLAKNTLCVGSMEADSDTDDSPLSSDRVSFFR